MTVTTELPILQFHRLRNNVASLAEAAEVSGVSVVGLYDDALKDISSIENAFHKYMSANQALATINSDLVRQNSELQECPDCGEIECQKNH